LVLNGLPPAGPPPNAEVLKSDQGLVTGVVNAGRYCGRSLLAGPKRGPSLRRGRSSAVFTRNLRPSISWPSKRRIASAASASLENSTNANPRERPVSRSVPMCRYFTCPAAESASESCCSVVRKLRLPIKTLVEMADSFAWRGIVEGYFTFVQALNIISQIDAP